MHLMTLYIGDTKKLHIRMATKWCCVTDGGQFREVTDPQCDGWSFIDDASYINLPELPHQQWPYSKRAVRVKQDALTELVENTEITALIIDDQWIDIRYDDWDMLSFHKDKQIHEEKSKEWREFLMEKLRPYFDQNIKTMYLLDVHI